MSAFSFAIRQPSLRLQTLHRFQRKDSGAAFFQHTFYERSRPFSSTSPKHVVMKHIPSQAKSTAEGGNTMVILYGWLLAKSKHLEKFGDLYSRHGADVVTVKPNVAEVLRPKKAEEIASRILDTLESSTNQHKPILIHAFSVGGYFYSQTLNKIITEPRYASVKDRIIGQIFDSPVDIDDIPFSISNATTDNRLLKNSLMFIVDSYLKLTRKYTMDKYIARSKLFFNNPVRSPALFLFSNDDPVSSPEGCERCIALWKDQFSMDVTSKKWDRSSHVSHFYKHQEEYTSLLVEFLKKVGVIGRDVRVDKI